MHLRPQFNTLKPEGSHYQISALSKYFQLHLFFFLNAFKHDLTVLLPDPFYVLHCLPQGYRMHLYLNEVEFCIYYQAVFSQINHHVCSCQCIHWNAGMRTPADFYWSVSLPCVSLHSALRGYPQCFSHHCCDTDHLYTPWFSFLYVEWGLMHSDHIAGKKICSVCQAI